MHILVIALILMILYAMAEKKDLMDFLHARTHKHYRVVLLRAALQVQNIHWPSPYESQLKDIGLLCPPACICPCAAVTVSVISN